MIVVEVPNNHGEWQEVSKRKDTEKVCMHENKTQISQSMVPGTPFIQELLLGEFGYLTMGENAKKY